MDRHEKHPGFTLIELLVVVAIIAIVGAIGLSALGQLFASGALNKAENVVDALLREARALAVRDGCYTGVHFQRDANDPNAQWGAIFQEAQEDANTGLYLTPPGKPWIPDVAPPWLDTRKIACLTPGNGLANRWKLFVHVTEIPPAKLPDGVMVGREDYSQCGFNRGVFTTFTIVFAPDGTLVTQTGLVNARYVKAVASPASWWTDELFRDPHDPNSPSSSSRIFKVDDLTLELADSNVPPAHFIPTRAVRLLGLKDFLPVEGNPAAANNCVNTETTLLPVAPKVGGLLRPQ